MDNAVIFHTSDSAHAEAYNNGIFRVEKWDPGLDMKTYEVTVKVPNGNADNQINVFASRIELLEDAIQLGRDLIDYIEAEKTYRDKCELFSLIKMFLIRRQHELRCKGLA